MTHWTVLTFIPHPFPTQAICSWQALDSSLQGASAYKRAQTWCLQVRVTVEFFPQLRTCSEWLEYKCCSPARWPNAAYWGWACHLSKEDHSKTETWPFQLIYIYSPYLQNGIHVSQTFYSTVQAPPISFNPLTNIIIHPSYRWETWSSEISSVTQGSYLAEFQVLRPPPQDHQANPCPM